MNKQIKQYLEINLRQQHSSKSLKKILLMLDIVISSEIISVWLQEKTHKNVNHLNNNNIGTNICVFVH